MPDYHFQTREFGVSDEGIHLLRNGFNYKTYNYSEIKTFTVAHGKEVRNWIVLLICGIALILFAIWYSMGLPNVFNSIVEKGGTRRVAYVMIVPLLPLFFGSYCIYTAMKTETILRFTTVNNKTDFISLKELKQSGQLDELKKFLKAGRR